LPIIVDVQTAWNLFKTSADKHFTAVATYMISDGPPKPVIDIKVDYDYSAATNTPDIATFTGGAMWDVAEWDVDFWAQGERPLKVWNGVCPSGVAGAVRLTAAVYNCHFAVTGWDVAFEEGYFGP
jgi:hypothetical protein